MPDSEKLHAGTIVKAWIKPKPRPGDVIQNEAHCTLIQYREVGAPETNRTKWYGELRGTSSDAVMREVRWALYAADGRKRQRQPLSAYARKRRRYLITINGIYHAFTEFSVSNAVA